MLPFKLFYNKNYLDNILSFNTVANKFRITINTDLDPSIKSHPNNGTIIIFKKYTRVLYYFDTTNMEYNIINSQVADYNFMNIVDINKVYFHQRGIKGAYKSIIFQQLAVWPSTHTLK